MSSDKVCASDCEPTPACGTAARATIRIWTGATRAVASPGSRSKSRRFSVRTPSQPRARSYPVRRTDGYSGHEQGTTKGNNLVGTTPTDQTSTPPTAGQDKPSGNDLVSPKGDSTPGTMKLASAAHPDFNTLDTTKKGTLTADEVKGDSWLSTNFSRCDLNHDGTLSRQEYAACK